jgi:pimeloyl-ACP methyl ester carboxylesterase
LLEKLIEAWPHPVEELVIIGHSMGGLVARSACHYGILAGHTWPGHLRKVICLGTPHHGSSLEQIGNWTGGLLKITRYSAPFRRLGTHRSAGITDLRYGNVVDEDWAGLDRFGLGPDNRRPVPLPRDIPHYTIGASLGATHDDLKGSLLGDGMVLLASALGLHDDPERCLAFPRSHQWAGYGMGHLDLLSRTEVYQKIKDWLAK